MWGREEELHRPSGGIGAGGGATQAVRGCGDGRRGYTGRQRVWGQEEGLHRPSGGIGAGGGARQAVRECRGGRRGYTGREGVWGREEELHRPPEGVGTEEQSQWTRDNIYIFSKDHVKLSLHFKLKVMLL